MNKPINQLNLSSEQFEELKRLKLYFPFRVCFGAIHPNGDFQTFAKSVKPTRYLKGLVSKGYIIYQLN